MLRVGLGGWGGEVAGGTSMEIARGTGRRDIINT